MLQVTFRLLILSVFFTFSLHAETLNVKVCFLDIGFGKYSNKEMTGIWQRKIVRALEKSNGKIIPVFSPRERCVVQIKEKSVDAIIAAHSKEHETLVDYPMNSKNEADKSKKIGVIKYFAYKHRNSKVQWDGKKISHLGPKKVGVQRGLYSRPIFESSGIPSFEEVNTITQGIEKVSYQRNELFIAEELQGDIALSGLKVPNVVKLPKPFLQDELYVAFTKNFYEKNQKFVKQFWNELGKLRYEKEFYDAFFDPDSELENNINLTYQN